MTDRPQGEGWWLASDGRWYPPETRSGEPLPPPPATWPRADPTHVSKGLAYVTFWMLLATALVYLAYTVTTIGYLVVFRSGSGAGVQLSDLERAEEAYWLAFGMAGIFYIACGVVFIVWTRTAYRTVLAMDPVGNNWSPGWAIGAWFIPLANWVIPRLLLSEVERMSHPASGRRPIGDRWRQSPTDGLGRLWWAFFITANITWSTSLTAQGYILSDLAFERWVMVEIGAGFLFVVAAVLAAPYVRRIGTRLGPHTA